MKTVRMCLLTLLVVLACFACKSGDYQKVDTAFGPNADEDMTETLKAMTLTTKMKVLSIPPNPQNAVILTEKDREMGEQLKRIFIRANHYGAKEIYIICFRHKEAESDNPTCQGIIPKDSPKPKKKPEKTADGDQDGETETGGQTPAQNEPNQPESSNEAPAD